jgi:hypothetical protein
MARVGVLIGLGVVVVSLLICGVVMDLRARRRGRRIDRAGLSAELRENRRDVRAWERGSVRHSWRDLAATVRRRRR